MIPPRRLQENVRKGTPCLVVCLPKDKVQCRLLLDVVISKGASIFELFSGKDQALLVRGNALFVLNFGLDIVDRVVRLDLQGNGLTYNKTVSTSPLMSLQIMRVIETCGWTTLDRKRTMYMPNSSYPSKVPQCHIFCDILCLVIYTLTIAMPSQLYSPVSVFTKICILMTCEANGLVKKRVMPFAHLSPFELATRTTGFGPCRCCVPAQRFMHVSKYAHVLFYHVHFQILAVACVETYLRRLRKGASTTHYGSICSPTACV